MMRLRLSFHIYFIIYFIIKRTIIFRFRRRLIILNYSHFFKRWYLKFNRIIIDLVMIV